MTMRCSLTPSDIATKFQIQHGTILQKRKGAGITHVDLSIPEGSIIGLVGTNGAGKTTLLRMISGILPLEEGTVKRNDGVLDSDALRSLVGFMPEQVRWSSQGTIRRTMTEFAHLRGCSVQSALMFLPLWDSKIEWILPLIH